MTSFATDDGLVLEGAWSRVSGTPTAVAVLAHPHPQHGGTMNAPLMRSIAGRLVDAGIEVLRFNFRGVARSEGGWGGGDDEVLDVAAAVSHARSARPDLALCIGGWSFGAVTALRWQAMAGDTAPYAGVAPPLHHDDSIALPGPADLAPARRLLVLGDRDQFCTIGELAPYAEAIGARFEVVNGSDHFFVFRDMLVGRLMADHFRGDAG
jgi:uncharacterized protein